MKLLNYQLFFLNYFFKKKTKKKLFRKKNLQFYLLPKLKTFQHHSSNRQKHKSPHSYNLIPLPNILLARLYQYCQVLYLKISARNSIPTQSI